MLQFNSLKITQDKKHLIIDVQVQPLDYYENVVIDSIVIDTQNTFTELGPSSKPLMTINCGGVKRYVDYIDIDTIADNLFFVYAITSGEPADNTPCGMTDPYVLGVTYDKQPFYIQGMNLFGELNGCEPARNFIDYILQQQAFNISLETGNYNTAINYWNSFFDKKETTITSKCGCYGRIR